MAGPKRGPAPKRAADRERRNTPETGESIELTQEDFDALPFEVELLVEPPAVGDHWHDAAKQVYEATLRDPARVWMGPLDWATHWFICEQLHRELSPQYVATLDDPDGVLSPEDRVVREEVPMKGASLTAVLKWFAMIGAGESSRLALRREVTFHQQPKTELASVTELDIAETREGFFQDGGR